MIRHVCIIGLGLIGGSIAKAIRHHGQQTIHAIDSNSETLDYAIKHNIVDSISNTIDDIKDTDLIILAVSSKHVDTIFQQLSTKIPNNCIVTDTCSVKQPIINSAKHYFANHLPCFVPGHPITGSEQHGIAASQTHLFNQQAVILTPIKQTDHTAVNTVSQFWQQLNAQIHIVSPEHHDIMLGLTSHLPHVLAYAFMNTVAKHNNSDDLSNFIGSGFKDFTRIAASNANLWTDILNHNKENVLQQITQFEQNLNQMKQALETGKINTLYELIEQSQQSHNTLFPRSSHEN